MYKRQILLCESDGTPEEVEEEIGRMSAVLREHGATAIAAVSYTHLTLPTSDLV